MKNIVLINSLNLRYCNIILFSFKIIRRYKAEGTILRSFSLDLFPSWLFSLRVGNGISLYDEFNTVNIFELESLSLPWSRFLREILYLCQNIEKHPSNLDVDYLFEKLPLIPHQLKCFKPLLSLKFNLIDPNQLKGMSMKDLSRGVILNHLENNTLLSAIDFSDTLIKNSKGVSSKVIFLVLIKPLEFFNIKWKNWLNYVKNFLFWYDFFQDVERSALISDLGYKFDYIPLSGFDAEEDFYLYENHSFVSRFCFPIPNDISLDYSSLEVDRILVGLMGEGFRKRLTLFRELDLIKMYFCINFLKGLKKKIKMWKFLERR